MLNVIMLSDILLNVIMLSVFMLNAITLNVVAPPNEPPAPSNFYILSCQIPTLKLVIEKDFIGKLKKLDKNNHETFLYSYMQDFYIWGLYYKFFYHTIVS
jgi:hypothetical protein